MPPPVPLRSLSLDAFARQVDGRLRAIETRLGFLSRRKPLELLQGTISIAEANYTGPTVKFSTTIGVAPARSRFIYGAMTLTRGSFSQGEGTKQALTLQETAFAGSALHATGTMVDDLVSQILVGVDSGHLSRDGDRAVVAQIEHIAVVSGGADFIVDANGVDFDVWAVYAKEFDADAVGAIVAPVI